MAARLREWLHRLYWDFKAWQRGERRRPGCAQARGRVYISAKVLRANGKVEDLGVISKDEF